MGLGLSMASGFARQSGGRLEIQSTEGVGTTIKVFLPRCVVNVTSRILYDSLAEQDDRLLEGVSVLIVEGEWTLLSTLVFALRKMGAKVSKASTGEEAQWVSESPVHIDLLLVAMSLHGNDNGRDVGAMLCATYRDAAIIYMSEDEECEAQGLDEENRGAFSCRSFYREKLRETLEKALRFSSGSIQRKNGRYS